MDTTDALARSEGARLAVAIDLIGDLDATLGVIFSDTLSGLVADGTRDVVLMTKHVSLATEEGLRSIDGALGSARANGCSVVVEPGSRRMKAAFAAARVTVEPAVTALRPRNDRHLMIARHAEKAKLRQSA